MHIAAVVLNYNSNEDLFRCIELLRKQEQVKLSIIIVDNCSSNENRLNLKYWAENNANDVEISASVQSDYDSGKSIHIIFNEKNNGYSAGNNIGIRYSWQIGAEAVLIINPDVIIEDSKYLFTLSQTLFSNKEYAVAGSKIIGLDSKEQSPSRDSSFMEELLWFRKNKPSLLVSYVPDKPSIVPKISGSCLLLKNDFLKSINGLDEHVFMYAEESILSKTTINKGYCIVFDPRISAVHAHDSEKKGNRYVRMCRFIESRAYYIDKYSGYPLPLKLMLHFSMLIMKGAYWTKNIIERRSEGKE